MSRKKSRNVQMYLENDFNFRDIYMDTDSEKRGMRMVLKKKEKLAKKVFLSFLYFIYSIENCIKEKILRHANCENV